MQGTRVLREMGGSADGLDDILSELGLSDKEDGSSNPSTPRSSSLERGSRSISSGSIDRTVSGTLERTLTLEDHSGSFSIDANSGMLVLDETMAAQEVPKQVTVSGPLPFSKSHSARCNTK